MIKHLQFIGRPPLLGGQVATGYLRVGQPAVVKELSETESVITIICNDGTSMDVPRDALYITRDGADEPVARTKNWSKGK